MARLENEHHMKQNNPEYNEQLKQIIRDQAAMTRLGNIDQQFKENTMRVFSTLDEWLENEHPMNQNNPECNEGFNKIVRDPAIMITLGNIDQQFNGKYDAQLMMLIHAGQIGKMPHLFSLENNTKLLSMIDQALWEHKKLLLQLPHIDEDKLKSINSKYHVKNLDMFVRLYEENEDLMNQNSPKCNERFTKIVCDQATMTRVGNIDQQFKGKYDALPHIDEDILKYVNSKYHIKTLEQCVRLNEGDKRKRLRNLTKKQYCNVCKVLGNMPLVNTQINVEVNDAEETNVITVGSLVTASVFLSRKSFSSLMNVEDNSIITIVLLNEPKVMKEEVKEVEDDIRNLDASISQDEDSENKGGAKDDEDWDKFQNPFSKRQKVLERKSRSSHSAHCPYFSEDMQEFWWVYLTDKKIETILTAPFQVTNLLDKKEIMMAFTAPVTPGLNKFTLCVRSDSHLGLDQFKSFTLDVKRAPEQPKNHPQYDFSSDEDERGKRLNLIMLRIHMTLQSLTIQMIRSLKTQKIKLD
ncbi:hypothetical protein QYM36_006951 [Artemia franciscana]|uniref:SEC63 domain-containing protein n=1 Tax=Artemia franciscana TaxID=6661 RepID=A0AA88I1W8_ARTSF|nr:hypothetical protein QYM36_006951 [Artemia franciscana]